MTTLLTSLSAQLGPLTWPLLLCSLLGTVVILERLIVLIHTTVTGVLAREAGQLLSTHADQPRPVREELAALWLSSRQRRLSSGIRLLNIIALLAPLLGLLGTVIGLIQAFDALGMHAGPIEPALLAEGLGIAMRTTAAGLLIALPTLAAAHGLQWWVETLVQRTEDLINHTGLVQDGILSGPLS